MRTWICEILAEAAEGGKLHLTKPASHSCGSSPAGSPSPSRRCGRSGWAPTGGSPLSSVVPSTGGGVSGIGVYWSQGACAVTGYRDGTDGQGTGQMDRASNGRLCKT